MNKMLDVSINVCCEMTYVHSLAMMFFGTADTTQNISENQKMGKCTGLYAIPHVLASISWKLNPS